MGKIIPLIYALWMNSNYVHTMYMAKLTREHIFWNKIPVIKKNTVLSCQSIISFLNNDSVTTKLHIYKNEWYVERKKWYGYLCVDLQKYNIWENYGNKRFKSF